VTRSLSPYIPFLHHWKHNDHHKNLNGPQLKNRFASVNINQKRTYIIKSIKMKKRIFRYLMHIIGTIVVIFLNGSLGYGINPLRLNLDREGPYIFYKNDSTLNVNYIGGNKTDGFYVDQEEFNTNDPIPACCFFPLDSSIFHFTLKSGLKTPNTTYSDGEPILPFRILKVDTGRFAIFPSTIK
jgi:hypothetical protein